MEREPAHEPPAQHESVRMWRQIEDGHVGVDDPLDPIGRILAVRAKYQNSRVQHEGAQDEQARMSLMSDRQQQDRGQTRDETGMVLMAPRQRGGLRSGRIT